MEVYYKRIKSNRKTSKRLCLVRVMTVIAQDNMHVFLFLAKVVSASSGAMIILIFSDILMF
jgi:hypothetical protein